MRPAFSIKLATNYSCDTSFLRDWSSAVPLHFYPPCWVAFCSSFLLMGLFSFSNRVVRFWFRIAPDRPHALYKKNPPRPPIQYRQCGNWSCPVLVVHYYWCQDGIVGCFLSRSIRVLSIGVRFIFAVNSIISMGDLIIIIIIIIITIIICTGTSIVYECLFYFSRQLDHQ